MVKKRFIYLMAMIVTLTMLPLVICSAQKVALKTNFAYWPVLASPNASVEVKMSDKWTADLGGGFNLWAFKDGEMKIKHWALQPEVRYWFCEVFNGTFVGMHAHGGMYNIGGFDIPVGRLKKFKEHRYEGYAYGLGVSIGHQWVLSRRWNLEASIGGGWARTHYSKFDCVTCGALQDEGVYDYFGVTRATLSLVYFIK